MADSTFVVTERGIKAFPAGNRIDFVLQQPGKEPARASVYAGKLDADVKLEGKKLQILPVERNEDGSPKHPNRLSIKWGKNVVNLGFVSKNGIKPYYYRGLESANERAAPKTPEDILAMMGL